MPTRPLPTGRRDPLITGINITPLVDIVLVLLMVGVLAGIKFVQIRTLMAAGKAFTPPPENHMVIAWAL